MGIGMGRKIRSTVIIPNYNGIQYIEKCLRSLAGEPARVVVVDNGSADGSREVVKEKFPQAQLVCLDQNYGFCKAVNVGIAHSTTPYVILLNNDTQVQPGFVRALEEPMERHPEVFSGSAQMRNMHKPELIDDAGDYYCALGWAFARGKDKRAQDYEKKCYVFSACGGAAIYRRKLFDELGVMDENHFAYLEDVDLGYRGRIHGYRNLYIPGAVVYHAGSAVSGSRHNKFKVDLTSKNSIYLIYKNMPAIQLLLNLPLLFVGFTIKFLFFARKGLGGTYLNGLWKGFRLCKSEEGRAHKVRFRREHFYHYAVIQLELWQNIFMRLMQ